MTSNFIEKVIMLFNENKWEEILDLKDNNNNSVMWVWPSKENLYFIKKYVLQNGCNGVTSIGCGCGLFEWLLNACTGRKLARYR